MTDEDLVAAKLKGYISLVKFKDGEELLLREPTYNDEDEIIQWYMDAEKFINGCDEDTVEYFPSFGFAVTRDSIKYIRKI